MRRQQALFHSGQRFTFSPLLTDFRGIQVMKISAFCSKSDICPFVVQKLVLPNATMIHSTDSRKSELICCDSELDWSRFWQINQVSFDPKCIMLIN